MNELETTIEASSSVETEPSMDTGLGDLLNLLNNPRRRKQQTELSPTELKAELKVESVRERLRENENAALTAAGFNAISHNQVAELQAYKEFRASKKQLETDSLVDAIINDQPEKLGPLNPQLLLIRSLESMRELSPRYLNRFVAYIDALSRLEEAE